MFGSQAILGQFPDPPPELRQSVEVDVTPRTRIDRVDHIDGSIGEDSTFHREFGFYVHGLPIDEAARLPEGWRDRVISVRDEVKTHGKTGLCVEAHDLAASKLAAFRDKDRDFVRVLFKEGFIDARALERRVHTLDLPAAERARLIKWIMLTARDLRSRKGKSRSPLPRRGR